MPHLHFDLNLAPAAEAKRRFGAAVVARLADVMDTGTDHVGVTSAATDRTTWSSGARRTRRRGFASSTPTSGSAGPAEQKRRLALAFIDEVHRAFGVPKKATYVIYTEHDGPQFQLEEKVLPAWSPGEDPLADP